MNWGEPHEKQKSFQSSDDESDHSEQQISADQISSNKCENRYKTQESNLQSYFREMQFEKERFNLSKKSRKYSLQKHTSSFIHLKIDKSNTQEVSNCHELHSSIYTSQTVLDFISSENKATLSQIEQKILAYGFTKSSFFTEKLLIIESTHSKYFEIVTLQIQLSYYKTKIQILNTFLNNHIHNEGQIGGFGAFGNVYFLRFLHQNFAVKCIRFNTMNSQDDTLDCQQVLITVLREYFFLLLFSALQIGPKIRKIMGFDLIVSEECIQFSTQICIQKEIKFHQMKELKRSLKIMHAMKIVHRDIKPDNIMYSESLKKHIFIDFGGCMVLKQDIGEKTFTKFLGTAGFCTEQMFSLIGNSKSYVDLYFNDLYGLNQTFIRQKQFSRNLIQKIFIEEQSDNIDLIKNSSNPYCLLNLIKYSIYNQHYNDFFLYWRLILKKHIAQIDELQEQLLRFFMDLQPNEVLKQFYWKNIDEPIRTDSEFVDLSQIFSAQLTGSLAMWRPLPLKQQKFRSIINFYRRVVINHGNFTNKEKKILKTLLTKNNIENYIFSKKSLVKKIDPSISLEEKKCLRQAFLAQTDISTYFLIVVNYCTFAQNKYNAEFSLKVKTSQLANSFIEDLFSDTFKKIDEMFVCKSSQNKHLVKMFQYFLIYFWQQAPQIFKEFSMKNCISSLFLLGYPIYLHQPKQKLGFHLIQESQVSRFKTILRFWGYNLMILNFGNLLYDRNQGNFRYQCSLQQKNQTKELYSHIMSAKGEQDHEFYRLNNYFYTKIYLGHDKLTELSLKEAFENLQKDYQFKNIQKDDLQKWRILMRISFIFVASSYEINFHDLNFKNIDLYNKKVLENDMNCMPFLFTIPTSKYDAWSACAKLNEIIEIIDRIVNHEDISFRYFTNCRLLVAYRMKNYQVLKTIINLIVETTEKFTFFNMFIVSEQIRVVKELVSHEVQRIHFSNFMYQKDAFDLLINRGLQIGLLYSDMENKLNPLHKLKNDQRMDFKNFLMIVDNLNLILHQIKLIMEDFLSLNSKKKNSPFLTHQQQQIVLSNQENYKINLQKVKDGISNVFNKIKIEPCLAKDRNSINHYVMYHMNYFINQRQFQKAQQIFESHFGNIKTMKIDDQSERVKPVLHIFIKYCILKTRSQGQEIFWYEKLLDIYDSCRKKNCQIDPFKYESFYKCFFLGMIYCERNFEEIEEFLNFLTECLRLAPTRVNAQKFSSIIQRKLCCNCSDCFKNSCPKWNPSSFVSFLQNKIGKYQKVKDSYMSFIFYHCLQNKKISFKSKKKFIEFIRKSINHLSYQIGSIVTHRLHQFRLMFYNFENGLGQHFQIFKRKLKSIPNLTQSDFNFLQCQFLSKLRQNIDQKVIKKHIYFYVRHLKNHNEFHSLSDTVQRQFIYKQRFLFDFNIPENIKQLYRKKLSKYHFIRQNYRSLYPPSKMEVDMHEIFFKK